RVARFMAIGVLSTLAYALLLLALKAPLGTASANASALALTAVANTAANRRFTFGLQGRRGRTRQYALGGVVYALTLAVPSGALAVLHGLDARPSQALTVTVLVAASVAATVTRYVALRSWVFVRRRPAAGALAPATEQTAGHA